MSHHLALEVKHDGRRGLSFCLRDGLRRRAEPPQDGRRLLRLLQIRLRSRGAGRQGCQTDAPRRWRLCAPVFLHSRSAKHRRTKPPYFRSVTRIP